MPPRNSQMISPMYVHFVCLCVKLYNNTLHNRVLLDKSCNERIQSILYVVPNTTSATEDVLVTTALRLGWTVLTINHVSQNGLPIFKEMYLETQKKFPNCIFYGFANGDILFTAALSQTLQAVARVSKSLSSYNQIEYLVNY